jgi:two-component system, chemotaxis family, protein-glutamate methylesterase/glutaminase
MVVEKSGKYQAVVIGVSAGGIAALEKILPEIQKDCTLSVMIVQHITADGGNYLVEHFSSCCPLPVVGAEDKQSIESGTIYFAPANYHLLVERQKTFALSLDAKINYSRPSIDVLFETAAEAYCQRLVGVVLTGANADGAAGLARVKEMGGLTIVQSPDSAEVATMPRAAIESTQVDHVLKLHDIGSFLSKLNNNGEE